MAETDADASSTSPEPGPPDHIIATTVDLIAAYGLKHVSKARRGELRNFTGIDSPYETPESAEFAYRDRVNRLGGGC